LKPGLSFRGDISVNATDMLIDELLQAQFIYGEKEKLIEVGIMRNLFMPHGLGHLLGLDVHDSTIYPDLIEPGMIITIEPGIYFNPVLIDKALADGTLSKYVNAEKLLQFRNFGGVRIEDDILITQNGYQVLTSAPKEISDIESVMVQN